VTLVQTEFGNIVAGYSHYKWNEVNGYVNDAGRHTLLLQLDCEQKMVPTSDSNLINCYNGRGPIFGKSDLSISDNCDTKNTSFTTFPTSYNLEKGVKYRQGQDSWQAFCGPSKGQNFKVVEYEVFKVIFK
jgi:hypothetical protein